MLSCCARNLLRAKRLQVYRMLKRKQRDEEPATGRASKRPTPAASAMGASFASGSLRPMCANTPCLRSRDHQGDCYPVSPASEEAEDEGSDHDSYASVVTARNKPRGRKPKSISAASAANGPAAAPVAPGRLVNQSPADPTAALGVSSAARSMTNAALSVKGSEYLQGNPSLGVCTTPPHIAARPLGGARPAGSPHVSMFAAPQRLVTVPAQVSTAS